MVVSKAPKAPKSPKSPWDMGFLDILDESDRIQGAAGSREKVEQKYSPKKVAEVDRMIKLAGVFQKKGDLASIIGAVISFLTAYFGSKKEMKEVANARASANKQMQAKKDAQEGRDTIRKDIDKKKEGAEEEGKVELVSNPKLGDGSRTVLIGDSAAHGMQLTKEWDKRPSFIGRDGMTTGEVLGNLGAHQGQLKGKSRAIIYCAGNNIFSKSPKDLVKDMIAMAKMCKKAEMKEIIVNSQFPADPRRKNLDKLIKTNAALRDELLRAYRANEFPSGTRVVDLTTPFSNERGEMKTAHVDRTKNDPLHPWSAYGPALDYMFRTGGSKAA